MDSQRSQPAIGVGPRPFEAHGPQSPTQIEHIEGRGYKSPDGSERYLVDEALLGSLTARLGAELANPVKTTRGTKSTLDDHLGPAEKTALRNADLLLHRWFGAEPQ